MPVKRFSAYIYPSEYRNDGKPNIYIRNFVESCKEYCDFVNKNLMPHAGFFDILKFRNKIDILFLNWPEEVPERKGGLLQACFYIALVWYLKFKGVVVVWTLHNKVSHVVGKAKIKHFLRKFTARNADYIITHAREGLEVIRALAPKNNNIRFFHHPVNPVIRIKKKEIKYDVLIWGLVSPYKGVDKFLEYLRTKNISNISVAVAGKIEGAAYREKILAFQNEHTFIFDRFVTNDELQELISESRLVLFTYLNYSILSSGALMDTIRYMPLIAGPACGAFNDLREEGLIYTYHDFDELLQILQNQQPVAPESLKFEHFINMNSWLVFGSRLFEFIKIKA